MPLSLIVSQPLSSQVECRSLLLTVISFIEATSVLTSKFHVHNGVYATGQQP